MGNEFDRHLIVVGAVLVLLVAAATATWIGIEFWWFDHAADVGQPDVLRDVYWVQVMNIKASLFKRTLGMVGGLAVMFVGVLTATVTTRSLTRLGVEAMQLKVALATASPGLVALVCGAFVVCFIIASKDSLGAYTVNRSPVGQSASDDGAVGPGTPAPPARGRDPAGTSAKE